MYITQEGGRGESRPGALGRMVSWLTWVRGQRPRVPEGEWGLRSQLS